MQAVISHFAHVLKLLLKLTGFLGFDGSVPLQQLVFPADGPLSFLLLGTAPGHFDKNLFRRANGVRHIPDNIQRPMDGSANAAGQPFLHQPLREGPFIFRLQVVCPGFFFNGCGKGIAVRQQLHQIFIAVPHPFQNGFLLTAFNTPARELCQESSGQAAKALEILPDDVPAVLFRKSEIFTQPAKKPSLVFTVSASADDPLCVRFAQFLCIQKLLKAMVSGQAGLDRFINAGQLGILCSQSTGFQAFFQFFRCDPFFLAENLCKQKLFYFHRNRPAIHP